MEIKQKLIATQIKQLDEKGRVILAVNAFGNVDADNDISMAGSFKKTLKENFHRVRWFLNHDVTKLLGVPVKAWETKTHLEIEAQFNLAKQLARDVYEDYKLFAEHGNTLEHSVGLQAVKFDMDQETGIRTVNEWKLWEFSTLTHWGANERTPLVDIKQRAAQKHSSKQYLFIEPSRYTQASKDDLNKVFNLLKIN